MYIYMYKSWSEHEYREQYVKARPRNVTSYRLVHQLHITKDPET